MDLRTQIGFAEPVLFVDILVKLIPAVCTSLASISDVAWQKVLPTNDSETFTNLVLCPMTKFRGRYSREDPSTAILAVLAKR